MPAPERRGRLPPGPWSARAVRCSVGACRVASPASP